MTGVCISVVRCVISFRHWIGRFLANTFHTLAMTLTFFFGGWGLEVGLGLIPQRISTDAHAPSKVISFYLGCYNMSKEHLSVSLTPEINLSVLVSGVHSSYIPIETQLRAGRSIKMENAL